MHCCLSRRKIIKFLCVSGNWFFIPSNQSPKQGQLRLLYDFSPLPLTCIWFCWVWYSTEHTMALQECTSSSLSFHLYYLATCWLWQLCSSALGFTVVPTLWKITVVSSGWNHCGFVARSLRNMIMKLLFRKVLCSSAASAGNVSQLYK